MWRKEENLKLKFTIKSIFNLHQSHSDRMSSIIVLLLSLRLTSAQVDVIAATELIERLINTQVAFNENFNVQIISSLNESFSSPLQRKIYDKLQQRTEWPVKPFGFEAFPSDFTLGFGLRNEIHVVLLSPLGFEQVLKWVSCTK